MISDASVSMWLVYDLSDSGARRLATAAAAISSFRAGDEYVESAAWLAVNQAEVHTAFVDTFPLKGFPEPVPVYRIEQTHRTRVITGQYIVITDLHGFSAVAEASSMTVVDVR